MLAPELVSNDPAEHSAHPDLPELLAYVPGEQSEHNVDPVVG
jgi:hypothetical protein